MPVLKRQFITDSSGSAIGVILPLEEFKLVEDILKQRLAANDADKLALMESAAYDPLFLADLHETMHEFAAVDAEWWEASE